MAQFYDIVKVNGINLQTRFGLKTILFNDKINRKFGLNKTLDIDENLETPVFISRKISRPSFTIELVKADNFRNILPISEVERDELARLIFGNDVVILEHKDRIYYGVFTNGDDFLTHRQGVLTLEFEMIDNKIYSRVANNEIRVNGTKQTVVQNKSNASKITVCDIEIKMIEGNSVKIKNITNGHQLCLNSIENEHIYIYGKEKEVVSKINIDKNIFNLTEGNFKALDLKYGRNVFEIEGNCKIKVIHQDELCF